MNYPSDYGRVAVNLPRDEKKALIKYSENTGHTLTWVVRQALKNYVENNSEDTKTTRLRKGTK
jgi:predicted DNA-binding protein